MENDTFKFENIGQYKIRQGTFNAFGTLIIDQARDNEFDPSYKVYENSNDFTIFIAIPGRVYQSNDNVLLDEINEENLKGILIKGNCGAIFKDYEKGEVVRAEGTITGKFSKKIFLCGLEKEIIFDKKDVKYDLGMYKITIPKKGKQIASEQI